MQLLVDGVDDRPELRRCLEAERLTRPAAAGVGAAGAAAAAAADRRAARAHDVHAMAASIVQLWQLHKGLHLLAATAADDGCGEHARHLAHRLTHLWGWAQPMDGTTASLGDVGNTCAQAHPGNNDTGGGDAAQPTQLAPPPPRRTCCDMMASSGLLTMGVSVPA